MPSLVFEIENFEGATIKFEQLTGMKLYSEFRRSTSRDFQIKLVSTTLYSIRANFFNFYLLDRPQKQKRKAMMMPEKERKGKRNPMKRRQQAKRSQERKMTMRTKTKMNRRQRRRRKLISSLWVRF